MTGLTIREGEGFQTWEMAFGSVNAIGPEFLDAIETALREASANEDIAVVVLASGLRVFSAGADAGWMAGVAKERGAAALLEDFNRLMDRFRELCSQLRRAPVLVVAAIGGHALAGGLELAAACDLRFAADEDGIRIGVPEMDLFGAMPTGGGGVQFLARLLGPARALEFVLDAKPISPRLAYERGLVQRLEHSAELLERTEAFASQVAAKAGRVGTAAAKRSVLAGVEIPLQEALVLDGSLHWDAMRRGNFLRGVDDFVARFG